MAQQGSVLSALDAISERKYAKAVEDAEFAISLEPNPVVLPEAYLLKAEALSQMERKTEALAVYRFLVHAYPESGAAYQARGRLAELGEPCAR
jgi:tetratricopeptide (TPR) repeat protein